MRRSLYIGLLIGIALLSSCSRPPAFSKEVQRITSPDGVADAIVYRSDSWISQEPATLVYLAKRGQQGDQLIFKAYRLKDFSLTWGKDRSTNPNWEVDRLLEINFSRAYITQFWSPGFLDIPKFKDYFVYAELNLWDDSALDWGPGDAPFNGS